jgi:hypothetical protein
MRVALFLSLLLVGGCVSQPSTQERQPSTTGYKQVDDFFRYVASKPASEQDIYAGQLAGLMRCSLDIYQKQAANKGAKNYRELVESTGRSADFVARSVADACFTAYEDRFTGRERTIWQDINRRGGRHFSYMVLRRFWDRI